MFFGVVFVLAIFGLFVTLIVYSYKKNQARLAAIAALCRARGWQLQPTDPFGLPGRWEGTPFDSGYDREAENVITGEFQGKPIVAFDYSYKEDSTDSDGDRSTTTYHYRIVALGMPCALPGLHLGPEGVLSRLGQVLGMDDIELESEEFNRRFRVRCPDRKFASDVLSPRTMEMLLASGKINFRFAGSDVVAYESGSLDAAELDRTAHVLAAVVDGVPSFVWRDYGLTERPTTPSPGNLT